MNTRVKQMNTTKRIIFLILWISGISYSQSGILDSLQSFIPVSYQQLEPGKIVLTPKDWDEMGFRMVGEIVRTVGGVYLFDLVSTGLPQTVSMNGFRPNQIQVFVDDIPANDPLLGTLDWNLIPIESVGRIEIYSMGNSTWGGSGAMGPVVRIFRKVQPPDNQLPYTRVFYRQGGSIYRDSDISFSHRVSKSSQIDASWFNGKSVGESDDFQGYKAQNLRLRLIGNFRKSLKYQFIYQYYKNAADAHGAYLPEQKTNIYPGADRTFFKSDLQGILEGTFREWKNPYQARIYFSETQDNFNIGSRSKNLAGEFGLNFDQPLALFQGTFTPGITYKQNHIAGTNLSEKLEREMGIRTVQKNTFKNLGTEMGAGLYSSDTFGDQFTYFANGSMKVAGEWLGSIGYDHGFRYPALRERSWRSTAWQGNPKLNTEISNSFTGEVLFQNSWLNTKVIFFSNEVKNQTFAAGDTTLGKNTWVNNFSGGLSPVQIDSLGHNNVQINSNLVRRQGVTWAMEIKWNRIKLGWHYTDIFATNDPLVPRQWFYGFISFHQNFFQNNLKGLVRISTFRVSRRDYLPYYQPYPQEYFYYHEAGGYPEFGILNFKAIGTIKSFQIFYEVENILSEDYLAVKGYYQYFWLARAGITWELKD
jgi:outer membrane cobalamin receptor